VPQTLDEADPDVLLEREIEKRKTGNQRLNGAVEALWSSLSKKKPLPFDMNTAQLTAVIAAVNKDDDEKSEASGKATLGGGGVAAALADFLPGVGGSKDKDKEKPDSKMVPVNALGIAMLSYSELLAASTASEAASALPSASTTNALSTSLGLLGRAYIQISQLQQAFATDVKSVLLTRLARSHVQLDAYAGARKRADAAKSRLDSARSKAQKSKREKRELEDELRIASAAYDDAISELEMRAEAVLYTSEAEDLSALTDYLHSHLDFLHQSVECLERVKESWAHADDRALNRGINAGTLMSSLHASIADRPRSRPPSVLSNSGSTVRPRKTSSRPGTAGSISAGRFGFPALSRTRSDTPDTASAKNAKGKDSSSSGGAAKDNAGDDDASDSAISDEEDEERMSLPKKEKHRDRTKSSGSTNRPTFNRSLSRLSIFGSKKEDGPLPSEAGPDVEKTKAASPDKEKSEDKASSNSRGWTDTFKAKSWKREKDRDTGGFANFGGGGADGPHEQRLDEEEQRRRADLLSGVSMGIEEGDSEEAPRLPKRPNPSGDRTRARTEWTTFSQRPGGGRGHEQPEFDDDGLHLGHVGRRESSATTDIFEDGSALASPLGHSPYPSDGMGMNVGPTGDEARMLAFNNTGLSALSAGEDGVAPHTTLPRGAGSADTAMQAKRSSSNPFGHLHPHVHQQDTGLSVGGMTDPGSVSHDDEAEEKRAVLTSNGTSSQTQRYRTGGILARAASGGVAVVGVGGSVRGSAPPPPVPPSSTLLKSRAPPPPVPNRSAK